MIYPRPARFNFSVTPELARACREVWRRVLGVTPYDDYLCRRVKIPTIEKFPDDFLAPAYDGDFHKNGIGYNMYHHSMKSTVRVDVLVTSKRYNTYLCRN